MERRRARQARATWNASSRQVRSPRRHRLVPWRVRQSDGFVPWRTCDAYAKRVASVCEKIGASTAPLAAFASFTQSRARNKTKPARFRFATFRERKNRPAPTNYEHARRLSIADERDLR